MNFGKNKFVSGLSVLIGACLGAGILGLPYVALKSGFFITLFYIIFLGFLFYLVNSFLGEVVLRTKGNHQLAGYAKKYLGNNARIFMQFALIFGIYSAIIAFLSGVGNSLSYLFFNNFDYTLSFGIVFGLIMSFLIKGGLRELKRFEKYGVFIVISILFLISILFVPRVSVSNLLTFNFSNFFIPLGVVLFAFMGFSSIPQLNFVLKGEEKYFEKVLFIGAIILIIIYSLFTFVVLGYMGENTPEIATLNLGGIFIILGILTMFTSYLAGGNALRDSFIFDMKISRKKSWVFSTIIPIILFFIISYLNFLSFTEILSIGGVVSGGIIAILSLLMVRKAKVNGNRIPEYKKSSPKWFIYLLIFIFLTSILLEIFL